MGSTLAPVGPVHLSVPLTVPTVSQARREWEGSEQKSLEGLVRCQKEAEAHLREVRERVDSLPRQVGEGRARHLPPPAPLGHPGCPPTLPLLQIEAVSNSCTLHKSDSDLKISAEGKAR